jgi:hypothetical protein
MLARIMTLFQSIQSTQPINPSSSNAMVRHPRHNNSSSSTF